MKRDIKETLTNELYKAGFGMDYCRSVANVICEIEPSTPSKGVEWKQDILYDRLTSVKTCIRHTLIKDRINSVNQ